MEKRTRLIYIWDVYCAWCFGFDKAFTEFYAKHKELDLLIISGGLFIGDRISKVSDHPYMNEANKQIEQRFDISMGEKYKQVLAEGSYVLNSNQAASVFALYRKYLKNADLLAFAYEIQKSFFIHGKDLSESQTYLDIAKEFGLLEKVSKEDIENALKDNTLANKDFQTAYKLGARGFPTILVERDGKVSAFGKGAMTLADLEENYKRLSL